MWKLLKGVIADQIYAHLDQEKLLPEEQKRCRKDSRGTNDLLYIDRAVIKACVCYFSLFLKDKCISSLFQTKCIEKKFNLQLFFLPTVS